MPTLYGDDGKGNVAESISVASDQKFWWKGYADKVADRVDVWFDQYQPYPPYDYVRSIWICTLYANQQRYFDSYPNDLCWIHDTGRKDGFGSKIWELYSSKGGKLWSGPIETNLGFKATENNFPSKYVKVIAARSPADIYELRIYFLKLPWANEALGNSILNSLAEAVNPIIQPLGYRYIKTECTWDQSFYSIYFEKTGSPVIPLAAIAVAVLAIFLGIGLLLNYLEWRRANDILVKAKADETAIKNNLTDLLAQGKITPEQYAEIMKQMSESGREIPWTNILILVGVLGGAYSLSKAAGSHARKEVSKELV